MAWKWLCAVGLNFALAKADPIPIFPLRTSGRFIVDAEGNRVRLKCVNWYGAHLQQLVANGLNKVTPGFAAESIAKSGFNCVRLPFSLDGVIGNASIPDPQVSLAGCPELQRSSALEVFDATVAELTKKGLMVILNNHVSSSMWCCSTSDGEGLWYTDLYPEDSWLEAIGFMAARYKDNPLVMGFDLRNEIRPSGAVWPDWGTKTQTDWASAAVRAAEKVMEVNEKMLIIISGLYFSIFLCQVPAYPVHAEVPSLDGRVVYTAHEYNWFNFHLAARKAIELYMLLLIAAFPFSWLVLRLLDHLRRKGLLQAWCCRSGATATLNAPQDTCASRNLPSCGFCLEFSAAAICAGLFALSLKVLPSLIQNCDIRGAYIALACGILTPICALVSIVLFTRAGFLAMARRAEIRASSLNFELPMLSTLEGTEGTPSASPSLAPQPSDHGCTLPQQAKWCRSSGCVVVSIMLISLVILLAVWYEFGEYEAFARELDFKWGFLASGSAPAPVWLGEFGTNEESLWWKHIMRYLSERQTDFAYWAVNGEKYNGQPESFSLFLEDFTTPRHPWKLQQLQAVMAP